MRASGDKSELNSTYFTYFMKYQSNVKYGVFYFRRIEYCTLKYVTSNFVALRAPMK